MLSKIFGMKTESLDFGSMNRKTTRLGYRVVVHLVRKNRTQGYRVKIKFWRHKMDNFS